MKKSLLAMYFLAVLVGSFLGSAWFHQWGGGKQESDQGGRKVLYYVDPMNPSHTSDKPGLAPCGMSMEPVYAEGESSGSTASPSSMSPGTVKISPEKQQTIGVRVEQVERTSHGHTLRALGTVAADENRTYRVIASTDGWVQDVLGSTTGSLVRKEQVMALMDIYDTEFYNYQQQFITYAAYLRQTGAQAPRGRSPRARQPEPTQPEAQQPEAQPQSPEAHPPAAPPAEAQQPAPHQHEVQQMDGMQPEVQQPAPPSPQGRFPVGQHPGAMPGEGIQGQAMQPEAQEPSSRQSLVRFYVSDNTANRAKLELLNVGFTEEQIDEIARTGQYRTQVEIRSPVTGFVLARDVSPRQKVDKGAELYRIADLTRVWILADVFEREVPFLRPGTVARVTSPQQGKSYEARVADVIPRFDTAARTLKVRLEVDNPDVTLIPDMFVDVYFQVVLPPAINVPVDAVLDSGLRKTVFVDLGNGFFEPREVETGWRLDDRVEILGGLMPGERIVVSGNFLLDSESRMKLAARGVYGTPEKDPSCGMAVDPGKARAAGLTVESGGKTYFFCTPECKEQFERDLKKQSPEKPAEKGPQRSTPSPLDGQSRNEPATQELVKDPVCRMPVSVGKARAAGLETQYCGRTYYFCTEECRSQFMKSPQPYAEKADQEGAPHAVPNKGEHGHD